MSLKQLSDKHRIQFLKEFISEVVINSAENERLKKKIETEKIKRKYLMPKLEPLPEFGESVVFPRNFKKPKHASKQEFPDDKNSFQKSLSLEPIKSNFQRNRLPRKITNQPVITSEFKDLIRPSSPSIQKNMQTSSTQGGLNKLDHLIKDKRIQMIECPGPGKNVLVKVRTKISTTRISLNEIEIKEVINYFSKSTQIPIMGGILKAALGSLIISAVVSDHVGSRFIINKKSPYSLIEGIDRTS